MVISLEVNYLRLFIIQYTVTSQWITATREKGHDPRQTGAM